MSELDIPGRLDSIRAKIDAALRRRGPGPEVRLIGVSKRQPIEKIRSAHAAGLRDFGENYAQELRDKREALADLEDIRWHFIGGLQRNKVKYVLDSVIHTVDRVELLQALERRAEAAGRSIEALVEVNFGESQKSGLAPGGLPTLLDAFAELERVRCVGLMVIPPAGEPEATRAYFRRLRELRDDLASQARRGVELVELSMGMSADFEQAIAEGSTMVRVGTALFGPRASR